MRMGTAGPEHRAHAEGREYGPGLFFTGTDTGVGKTFVAAAVARRLRRQGHEVAVSKPVATGAAWNGACWLSDDTRRLGEASSSEFERITPWTFPEALAP